MASLIAGNGASGMNITYYTGPARDDSGDRTRYQITRRDPFTGREAGSDYITLDRGQLAELADHLDRLRGSAHLPERRTL